MSVGFVMFLAWAASAVPSLAIFFGVSGFFLLVFGLIYSVAMEKLFKRYIVIALTFFFISALLPSKEDMKFILATTGVYAVVTSDPAKQLGGKVMTIINKKLDEMGETK